MSYTNEEQWVPDLSRFSPEREDELRDEINEFFADLDAGLEM